MITETFGRFRFAAGGMSGSPMPALGTSMPFLTAPLPFFYHGASERVLYIAHGPSPSPLLFSIALKDVVRHELVTRGPVLTDTTHPFGTSTGVSSLVEDPVRRGLADTEIFGEPESLEDTLELWRDLCDAVAERLQNGEDLEPALKTTWVLKQPEGAV